MASTISDTWTVSSSLYEVVVLTVELDCATMICDQFCSFKNVAL
jgi:hypothetical protein